MIALGLFIGSVCIFIVSAILSTGTDRWRSIGAALFVGGMIAARVMA